MKGHPKRIPSGITAIPKTMKPAMKMCTASTVWARSSAVCGLTAEGLGQPPDARSPPAQACLPRGSLVLGCRTLAVVAVTPAFLGPRDERVEQRDQEQVEQDR